MSDHGPYSDFFEIEFCSPEYELAHRPRLPPKCVRTGYRAVDVSHAPGNPNINHD
jgi:hypothetical protein